MKTECFGTYASAMDLMLGFFLRWFPPLKIKVEKQQWDSEKGKGKGELGGESVKSAQP